MLVFASLSKLWPFSAHFGSVLATLTAFGCFSLLLAAFAFAHFWPLYATFGQNLVTFGHLSNNWPKAEAEKVAQSGQKQHSSDKSHPRQLFAKECKKGQNGQKQLNKNGQNWKPKCLEAVKLLALHFCIPASASIPRLLQYPHPCACSGSCIRSKPASAPPSTLVPNPLQHPLHLSQ